MSTRKVSRLASGSLLLSLTKPSFTGRVGPAAQISDTDLPL
jgi:hypothetical protein